MHFPGWTGSGSKRKTLDGRFVVERDPGSMIFATVKRNGIRIVRLQSWTLQGAMRNVETEYSK